MSHLRHRQRASAPAAAAGRLRSVPPPANGPERPEPFEVEVRPARGRVVVIARGELDLATADRVADAIEELLEAGFHEIVLDLRRVSFMDSSGLRVVIGQSRRPNVDLHLVDGSGPVARLFDLTGMRGELSFLAPDEVLSL
jgi:anti-sigma B factor antagonist